MVCHFRCGCSLQSTVWPLSTDSLQATDRGLWFRHPDHKPQDPTPGIEYQIRISNTRALSLNPRHLASSNIKHQVSWTQTANEDIHPAY